MNLTHRWNRLSWICVGVLAALLPSPLWPDAATRRVLVISVDGTRPDALQVADTPNLDALREGGAYSLVAQTEDVPTSGPCYSGMFTGVWRDKHGVDSNDFVTPNFDEYPIFFCRLKDANPACVTESIVRWSPLDSKLIACADHHFAPGNDEAATEEALRLLVETDPDVLFFHIEDVDTAGHRYTFSPDAQGYLDAIEASDERVGRVLAAVRSRPSYADEDWLVIAIADHGGSGTDHHANTPENRTIFMFLNGPGVVPGELDPPPVIIDVATTAMTYLGLAVDPAWDLDGAVIALSEESGPMQLPADCTQDGTVDLADAICLLNGLFLAAREPFPCEDAVAPGANRELLDSNGDGTVDVSDPVYLLVHLFAGGPAPALGSTCIPMAGCPAVCSINR